MRSCGISIWKFNECVLKRDIKNQRLENVIKNGHVSAGILMLMKRHGRMHYSAAK